MFQPLTHATISRLRAGALVAAIAALAHAAPAAAQEPATELSADDATEILETAAATVAPAHAPKDAEPALDATLALHDLAAAYPELEQGERREAKALLARPTDGGADPVHDGYPPAAPIASAESEHFCVFWVNSASFGDAPSLDDPDADAVPDYVELLLEIAERSYGVEVAPGPLGWEPPKRDLTGCGANPGTRSDIYLKQLGNRGLFGYQSVDPGQGRADSQYGYMVLDDDYARSEYGYEDPAIPAGVTFAHEFNHLLQANYDVFQDLWMKESTATWAEEKVFPDADDYVRYLPYFARFPGEPITATFPPDVTKSLRIYGTAVWNHWLDGGGGGYGLDAIRRAWEVSDITNPTDFALSAYDRTIERDGGKGFSREFVAFAAATAEWRSGFGRFPDRASYPDVSRKGSLAKDGRQRFKLDHTAYRLLTVRPRGGKLKLRVHVDRGVRAGLALVARDGDALSGKVTWRLRFLDKGGRDSVTLAKPRRFERITAVLVNADDRVNGFAGGDWVYSRDRVRFTARLSG